MHSLISYLTKAVHYTYSRTATHASTFKHVQTTGFATQARSLDKLTRCTRRSMCRCSSSDKDVRHGPRGYPGTQSLHRLFEPPSCWSDNFPHIFMRIAGWRRDSILGGYYSLPSFDNWPAPRRPPSRTSQSSEGSLSIWPLPCIVHRWVLYVDISRGSQPSS